MIDAIDILFVFLLVAFAAGGYYFGRKSKVKAANSEAIDYAVSWKNTACKQAKTIENINDRLTYFSLGEIEDLYDYLKNEEGCSDDTPLLGIVFPIDENTNWVTEYEDEE